MRRFLSFTVISIISIYNFGYADDTPAGGFDKPVEVGNAPTSATVFNPYGAVYYIMTSAPGEKERPAELWRYDLESGSNKKVLRIGVTSLDFAQVSSDGKYFFYGQNRISGGKLGAVRLDSGPGGPREEFLLHFDDKKAIAVYDDWEKKLYYCALKESMDPEDVVFSEGLLVVSKPKEVTWGWVDFGSEKYEIKEKAAPIGLPSAISEEYFYYGSSNYEEGRNKYWRTPKKDLGGKTVLFSTNPGEGTPIFLNGEGACLFLNKKWREPGQPLFFRFEDYSGEGPRPAVDEYRLPENVVPAFVQPPVMGKTGILIRKVTRAADSKSGAVEDFFFLDALTWEAEYLFTINVPSSMCVTHVAGWIVPSPVPGETLGRGVVHNLSLGH